MSPFVILWTIHHVIMAWIIYAPFLKQFHHLIMAGILLLHYFEEQVHHLIMTEILWYTIL